jgi:hypothetical protein
VVEQKTAPEEQAAPEPLPDFQAAPEPKTASPAGLDLTADLAEPKSSELEFLEIPEPPASAGVEPTADATSSPEETTPLAGLVSAEFVPPKDVSFRSHPELTHDFGASEPPDIEELEVETADEVELQSSGAAEFRVENAAEDFMDAVAAPAPMQREELELSPPPVYEVQAELEPELAPEPAPPPPAKPEPARTPVPLSAEPRRSYSVRETRGRSVASFFKTLLSARPAGPAAEGTDAVVSRRPPEEPVAEAQDTTVSFDDFFGAASGSTPAKQDEDPSKDDLDQFQSWLQNLKR